MFKSREIFIKKKEKIYSLILIGTSILILFNVIRTVNNLKNSKQIIYTAEDELRKEQETRKELEEKLQIVNSMEFVESQIRNELGMTKEGEIMVILPDEQIVKKYAPKIETPAPQEEKPNWKRWIELFI